MPTCNRFTQDEVLDQWQQINRLFKETLEEEFGPLIGNSSDGDSRRRKLIVQLMTKDETESFRPISEKSGFTFAAVKEQVGDHYVIRSLGDQDPIHNHKKLVNHLDHISRSLCIGPGLFVHMNHIEQVIQRLPVLEHGLTREHVRR